MDAALIKVLRSSLDSFTGSVDRDAVWRSPYRAAFELLKRCFFQFMSAREGIVYVHVEICSRCGCFLYVVYVSCCVSLSNVCIVGSDDMQDSGR